MPFSPSRSILPGWDLFRVLSPKKQATSETESGRLRSSLLLGKALGYLLSSLFVIVGIVTSVIITLLMTSQLREGRRTRFCSGGEEDKEVWSGGALPDFINDEKSPRNPEQESQQVWMKATLDLFMVTYDPDWKMQLSCSNAILGPLERH